MLQDLVSLYDKCETQKTNLVKLQSVLEVIYRDKDESDTLKTISANQKLILISDVLDKIELEMNRITDL
jgi:hypothetical protein